MSYILEAIKKADQKRKLGSVPDLHAEHGSTFTSDKRPRWPYWVAVALFINAGLIGWWLSTSHKGDVVTGAGQDTSVAVLEPQAVPKERSVIAPSTALDAESSEAETEPPEAVEEVAKPVESAGPGKPETAGGTASPVSSQGGVTELGVDVTPERPQAAVAPAPAAPVASVPVVPEHSPQTPEASEHKAETAEETAGQPVTPTPAVIEKETPVTPEIVGELGTPPTTPESEEDGAVQASEAEAAGTIEELGAAGEEQIILGGSSQPETEESVVEDDLVEEYKLEQEREADEKALERIPFDYQLPASTQKLLPDFHISFHVYVAQPSERIVSINGTILREGQTLDKKIKLEQITPLGVVLLFDSWRFKVEID